MTDTVKQINPTPLRLERHASVHTTSLWEESKFERMYLNLRGKKPSFAGDRSTKVFYDHKNKELVHQRGKGTISREFHESLSALLAHFVHTIL
jgi:hypothetical protein